jgi:hypothetical protein
MRSRVLIVTLQSIVAAVAIVIAPAQASVPPIMNFQGILLDSSNAPVKDSSWQVAFRVFDAGVGGALIWNETQTVTTKNGLFNTFLGSVNPISDANFSGQNRWLELQLVANPSPYSPRTQIGSVGYAFRAATIDGATGGSISGNVNLDPSSATSGNILKGGVPFIHDFGTYNTLVGRYAGNLTMSGAGNTATGYDALSSNISGGANTATGYTALRSNSSGTYNTASGGSALTNNTAGSFNTACGTIALGSNTDGDSNTAIGHAALYSNTTGGFNTAIGEYALFSNITGSKNTAIGSLAGVTTGALTNTTAIGWAATVNASNKIRLGNGNVTVIEGQVAYTFTSDKSQKENYRPVDGDEVLRKIRELGLTSWNYKGQDPQQFRHYGPVAQEFFAAFGHDGVGTSGTPTTINSGDEAGILMIAIQALEKNNETIKTENAALRERIDHLEAIVQRLVGVYAGEPANGATTAPGRER